MNIRNYIHIAVTAVVLSGIGFAANAQQSKLPPCVGTDTKAWIKCFGTEMNENGSKYMGEWKDGMPNGNGTYTYRHGDTYVGEWKDGKRNGKGTFTFPNGEKYVGEFKDDNRNGKGIEYSASGAVVYSGLYRDGEPVEKRQQTAQTAPAAPASPPQNAENAQSKLAPCVGTVRSTWNDCIGEVRTPQGVKVYVGEFRGGRINGQGESFSVDGKLAYSGSFLNSKMNGNGTYFYPNGMKHVGEFKDGKISGQGTQYSAEGAVLRKGSWEDNKFVGQTASSTVAAQAPVAASAAAPQIAQASNAATPPNVASKGSGFPSIAKLSDKRIYKEIIKNGLNDNDRDLLVLMYAFVWSANRCVTGGSDDDVRRCSARSYAMLERVKNDITTALASFEEVLNYLGGQIGASGSQFKTAVGIEVVTERKACDACDPAYLTLRRGDRGVDDPVYKGLVFFTQYLHQPGKSLVKNGNSHPEFEMAPQVIFEFYSKWYPSYFRPKADQLSKSASLVEVSLEKREQEQLAKEREEEKRRQWLATPEGKKYQADQNRIRAEQERQARANTEKEFPYYALITCGFNQQHMNALACFSGSVDTELELRNGTSYGLYKAHELYSLGQESSEGFRIQLRKTFQLKAQNSSDSLILGVKILNQSNGSTLFEKKVSKYGVISIKN